MEHEIKTITDRLHDRTDGGRQTGCGYLPCRVRPDIRMHIEREKGACFYGIKYDVINTSSWYADKEAIVGGI